MHPEPTIEQLTPSGQSRWDAAASEKGRVLLLEDDPSFKDVIRDFLVESSYTVVAVQNGGEGVREVLDGDFALVLCDMAMPSLSGEMFYRAVERIRPRLCERFVFMTGYRKDARANEFIENVSGLVLRKPFHLEELLDALAATEARIGLQKALEAASMDPALFRASPPASPFPAAETPHPPASEVAPEVPEPLPPAQADPAPRQPATVLEASEPQPRASVVSRGVAFAGLALFVSLAAILAVRYPGARDRAEAASAKRRTLEAEWGVVSRQAEQAEKARIGLVSLPERAKRIMDERKAGGWTGALRAVSMTAGLEIALSGVAARGIEGPPGACELRVEGVATGPAPRAVADGFHQALRRELERNDRGPVEARIEKLEDEPEPSSASSEGRRASFVFTVRVGSGEPPKTESVVTK